MKKIALTLLAAIFGFQVFAQQIQQVPLIEVEGFAERLISPDEAVFNIMLEEAEVLLTPMFRKSNCAENRIPS